MTIAEDIQGRFVPTGVPPRSTREWQLLIDWIEDNGWADGFTGAAETRKNLDAEYELLRKMLAELGVAAR